LALYTLGQRSGLGIGGRAGSAAAPWYVAGKDMARNALIVVQDQDHPLLLSDAFEVEQLHWLNSDGRAVDEGRTIECAVKTRYRQNDLDCTVQRAVAPRALTAVTAATSATGASSAISASGDPIGRVTLVKPARAVTPGQYAVFYQGALCLGGGVIARRFNSCMPYVGRGITYNSQFSVEGS
jgi:tRNA-specific 2-thiouridylase